MNIAIIGAGFTGLTAAFELCKKGHKVTIFEKDSHPGGLAIGYKEKSWEWSLEHHYHHWFTNDKFILNLAKEIGHKVIIKRPKTSILVDEKIYQFDSPKEVLLFPKLSIVEKIRMAATIASLRFNPFWKPLEKINANVFLFKTMGKKAYEMIWESQFKNKFGDYYKDISLAWFWARIVKRTPSLAYPEGGFLNFANHLVSSIEKKGGKFLFNTEITEITSTGISQVKYKKNVDSKLEIVNFDKIIVTLPTSLFVKIAPQLPDEYKTKYARLKSLGATNLVLRLKQPFLTNGTYWLSVCEKDAPIMAIVEHTNFMDKKFYNNEYLVYLGNYLPNDHLEFLMNKQEKLKLFDPFLKKINSDYKKHLIDFELFKAPFAQPIVPTNYSKDIPEVKTPLSNIYLANIQQVYPWDRGTNYAVELGEKVSKLVQK